MCLVDYDQIIYRGAIVEQRNWKEKTKPKKKKRTLAIQILCIHNGQFNIIDNERSSLPKEAHEGD
jgi:hypothetical protein